MQDDHGNQGRQRWTGRLKRVLGVLLLVLAGSLSGLPALWLQELGRLGRALPGEASRVGQAVLASEPVALGREAARTVAISALGVASETEAEPAAVAVDDAELSEPEMNDLAIDAPLELPAAPASLADTASNLPGAPVDDRAALIEAAMVAADRRMPDLAGLDRASALTVDGLPDQTEPGEAVVVPTPGSDREESSEVTTVTAPPQVSGPIHRVAPGETLSGIAVAYRVDLATLVQANGLDPSVPIVVGQRLVVPGGASQPVVATTAVTAARPIVAVAPVAPRPAAPAVALRPVVPVSTAVPPKPITAAVAAPTPARVLAAQVIPASAAPAVLPGGPLIRPVGGPVSQPFIPGQHNGVDLASATGTPIHAAAPGLVVVAAKLSYGYGWRIMLDHGSGTTTLYAHMSRLDVAPGDRVVRGQVIGAVGATGQATGPHLHFEVALRGAVVDPLRYLP